MALHNCPLSRNATGMAYSMRLWKDIGVALLSCGRWPTRGYYLPISNEGDRMRGSEGRGYHVAGGTVYQL
jgi:hypothetical protein